MSAGQLSLYIELEEGKKADLEVVARASLAYAAAIRSIAGFLDPLSDTRVDLIDSTEGSLSLNTKIRFKTASGTFEITLYALIFVFVAYIGSHIGDVLTEKAINGLWDEAFGAQTNPISEDDKKDIVDRAVKAFEAKAGERHVKQIYLELDRDDSITGIGVSKKPNERPKYVVPKQEFQKRSGVIKEVEPVKKERPRREVLSVVLVSPVLKNDRRRHWRFRVGDNEFGAPVKDNVFLDAVFSGKHPILVKGNVHMRVVLTWHEDFINGVWVARDYVVHSVVDVPGQYQGPQELLPFDDRKETHNKPKTGKHERGERANGADKQ